MAQPAAPQPAVLARVSIEGGVGVVTLDDPDARHVTITPALVAQLDAVLTTLEGDATVDAIVIRSAKTSFCAGANLEVVRKLRFATDAEDLAKEHARVFRRLAASTKPIVACVEGHALGGGFELTLACTATVAADSPTTTFALPEVKLGLIPPGNGLLRIAERAGLRVAADLGLTGRKLRAHDALGLGLIDELAAPAVALSASRELALRLARQPALRKGLARARRQRGAVHGPVGALRKLPEARAFERATLAIERALVEGNAWGRAVLFRRTRAAAGERTHGNYPGVDAIVDVLERFGRKGFRAAAKVEARAFGTLVVSPASRRLVELFFAEAALKRDLGVSAKDKAKIEAERPRAIEHVGVVGAGLMGAGIAAATVAAGLTVDVRDTDDSHLGRGLRYVRSAIDTLAQRGIVTRAERERALDRLHGTVDPTSFRTVDVIIEAVFEDLALKHEVVRSIEEVVSADCVIASNTSSFPIADIARMAMHPERIVGMHYFRPAWRVPLVEIVRTKQTSLRALATAIELGRRQHKNVFVVNDGPGFYATRVLAPLLAEAVRMVSEGIPIDVVDGVVTDWGFAIGPLRVFDEVGIDFAMRVAEVLRDGLGERMRAPEAFDALVRDDRRGRKNGRGFYLYATGYGRVRGARRRPDSTVYEALTSRVERHPNHADIASRCALALVNEALRCLEDGVLTSARDGDLAAVLGLGFPGFRGGPFRYVDTVGAREVLRQLRSYEQRFGPRFEPAGLLVDLARHGGRFYDQVGGGPAS